jgi:hypothetical protein
LRRAVTGVNCGSQTAGANIKQVQVRAGHSSVKVTLDVYGHLFPGDDEAVAEALDEGRRAALKSFRHTVGMKGRKARVRRPKAPLTCINGEVAQ